MNRFMVVAGLGIIAGSFVLLGGWPVLVLYAGIGVVILGATGDDHRPRR